MVPHKTINFLGASPDGIVSPYKLDGKHLTKEVGKMLEIKCPLTRKIKTFGDVKGVQCPIYYWVQVQLQLECCDLKECDFWQCSIEEYDDREDFIDDTNNEYSFLSNETNMEKGALIQLLPHKLPESCDPDIGYWDKVYSYTSFIYPPKIEMTPCEVDVWVAKTVSELHDTHPEHYLDRVIYWKMTCTHNVTIERDYEWFEENLPTYDKIWSYVTFFRENMDKANIVFDYINNLSIKKNTHIMEVYEKVCNPPSKNAKKEYKEYKKYIKNLIKEIEKNQSD